jgi:hypothetical protein
MVESGLPGQEPVTMLLPHPPLPASREPDFIKLAMRILSRCLLHPVSHSVSGCAADCGCGGLKKILRAAKVLTVRRCLKFLSGDLGDQARVEPTDMRVAVLGEVSANSPNKASILPCVKKRRKASSNVQLKCALVAGSACLSGRKVVTAA